MTSRHTKKHEHHMHDDGKVSFKFSGCFLDTFKIVIDTYSNSLKKLNDVIKGKIDKCDYGMCNVGYKLRYITPEDISTYASNLVKVLNNGMLGTNVHDIEMFAIASVKRFLEEKSCPPFEASAVNVMGYSHRYVNPKEYTLQDLIMLCETDVPNVTVYSNYEIKEKAQLAKEDVDTLNKMHFAAAMKNIITTLPHMIDKTDDGCMILSNKIMMKTFALFLQEFILFACSLNTITVNAIIDFCNPSTSYVFKACGSTKNDVVTECCMLKTNDMVIKNKLPFNCNMKHIVLQDTHPNFKDTKSAMYFIMNDPRSPIADLVRRYYPHDDQRGFDASMIARMFIGYTNDCCRDPMCEIRSENVKGNMTSPDAVTNFHTDADWLSKIAYGNNWLDGNYRRDNPGNHNIHPITNAMDVLYKMFSNSKDCCNEKLACNIVKVYNTMASIIQLYNADGFIPNWELTRDILALLGEIMTRDMLKLYYNNNRVFVYDDQMDDTVAPGYLYTESFVMEADETAPSVAFKNPSNPNAKATTTNTLKVGQIVRAFTSWVKNTLSKFSSKFNEAHKKEIEWINKNTTLNNQIKADISAGKFKPELKNYPRYKVPLTELEKVNVAGVVNTYLNGDEEIKEQEVLEKIYPQAIAKKLAAETDESKAAAMIQNYVLFSNAEKPNITNGTIEMSTEIWNDLIDNLTNAGVAIDRECKKISDDLTKALDTLTNKSREIKIDDNPEHAEQNEKYKKLNARIESLFSIVQKASRVYQTNTLNTLNSKFYNTSYKLYRDIVAGYKQQQGKSNQTSNLADSGNITQPTSSENAKNAEQGKV